MRSTIVFYLILASHGLLLLYTWVAGAASERRLPHAYFVWMAIVPVFGPLTCRLFMSAIGKTPKLMELRPQGVKTREMLLHQLPVNDIVPLEEALLIDDPRTRRALMMHVLRDDPMQYLDLLLIARFNEDTETAHYATATIMELQRHFQMEIHQRLAELARSEEDVDKHRMYAKLLYAYCESGLLEAQLLRRQRLILKKALEHCLRLEEDPALLHILVRNSLALGEADEARAVAQTLMTKWPLDEVSWLEGMRVYADTHDQSGMRELFGMMQDTPIDFTAKGREQVLFWKERNV